MAELASLFLAAFVAATLIPAQSEVVLVALILSGVHPVWLLVLVASVGNVLGSVLNWVLGRFLVQFSDRRWFPVRQRQIDRATAWYARYGRWSLLGAWLPVVGDPITLAAGILREPFWRFLAIVTLAKAGRYLAVSIGAQQFI